MEFWGRLLAAAIKGQEAYANVVLDRTRRLNGRPALPMLTEAAIRGRPRRFKFSRAQVSLPLTNTLQVAGGASGHVSGRRP
jgi:hypothetical protein